MAPGSSVRAFFLRAGASLVVALVAVWMFGKWMVLPVAMASGWVMTAVFSGWVEGVELQDTSASLVTALYVFDEGGRVGTAMPEVDLLSYCHGTALLAALFAAGPKAGIGWKFPAGMLALLPFQVWGVCFAWLIQVCLHMGPQIRQQVHFTDLDVNLFAAAYQLGFLLLPSLGPVLIWLALNPQVRQWIIRSGPASPDSPHPDRA